MTESLAKWATTVVPLHPTRRVNGRYHQQIVQSKLLEYGASVADAVDQAEKLTGRTTKPIELGQLDGAVIVGAFVYG